MEIIAYAEYDGYRIRNYIIKGKLDLDVDKNCLEDSINLKNTLHNDYSREGFTEIIKNVKIINDKAHIDFKFRLNTWLPDSQDLVFDKMKLIVEWDYEKEDGLLYTNNKEFSFNFPNKKLRKKFSGKKDIKDLFLVIV